MKLEDAREVLCMKEDAMSKLKKLRLVNIYKNNGGVIKGSRTMYSLDNSLFLTAWQWFKIFKLVINLNGE